MDSLFNNWRNLFLTILLLIIFVISIVFCAVEPPTIVEKLPYCGDGPGDPQRDISRRLLFVTTLDGKLSALDLSNKGSLKWSVGTTPGPLLSSSIHRLELTNNGKWVRMIPSLNGGLYKFDGDYIESVPITADYLLSSSFKFSDDLVISGGKETRSYGISSRNGKIIYECSIDGCKNSTYADGFDNDLPRATANSDSNTDLDHDPLLDDVIVLRRQTQTVRAVEPRTGGERWNFSVGHHEMEVLKTEDCHERPLSELEKSIIDLELKIIVPDGIICAINKNSPNNILWKYKFDHPIVSAWKTNKNDILENIDLFSSAQRIWNNDEQLNNVQLSPSIYLGMFNKQLYIQESDTIQEHLHLNGKQHHTDDANSIIRIPWKPYPATSSAIALLEPDLATDYIDADNIEIDYDTSNTDGKSTTTALSILYASDYVNGNGFYLYSDEDLFKKTDSNTICKKDGNITKSNNSTEFDPFEYYDENDSTMKFLILSLWYWWKEILVLSLTSLLVVNLFLQHKSKDGKEFIFVERHIEIKVPKENVSDAQRSNSIPRSIDNNLSLMAPTTNQQQEQQQSDIKFSSRFTNDFNMVQCLGKGGFGVVFEAKNKLDDCTYAIKRIVLPIKKESRERVMREVKTLANCEHQNIVRYFQAWVEEPPPGWQEREDKIWMDKNTLSHSIEIDSPTSENSTIFDNPNVKSSNNIIVQASENLSNNINKSNEKITKNFNYWLANLNTNECLNFDDKIRKSKFHRNSQTTEDDSLSFIQFERSSNDNPISNNADTNIDMDDTSHSSKSDNHNSDSDEFNSKSKMDGQLDDDLSNSVFTNSIEHAEDSFEIEFINPSNDVSNVNTTNHNSNNNNNNNNNNSNKYNKQRTISENNQCIISIECHQNETNGDTNGNNQKNNRFKIPFKKTHRRPMSLDLTSSGNVRERFDLRKLQSPPAPPPQSTNRMYLYIQMQLCKKQTLKDWLRTNDVVKRKIQIVPIFEQIVRAVEYVHLKGLIHRDLKPGNVFFSLDGQVKIGDFGLVTDMSDITIDQNKNSSALLAKHTVQVGTHLYMSPEQVAGLQYNYKVDIYSLGLIFFELLVVFGTEMERIETLKKLRSNEFPNGFLESFPDEYVLLNIMLSQLPDKRPTTFGIRARKPLCHSNVNNYHFELPPRRRDSSLNSSLNSSFEASNEFKLNDSY